MLNSGNIYFVYIGKYLPKYAKASLQLAHEFSGLKIHLIGSSELINQSDYKNVNFIDVANFYDDSELTGISKNLNSSHTYREGLWIKSLERFLVLEQFMKFEGINTLLHCELDQILFGVDSLLTRLESQVTDGLYLPYHKSGAAVASLVFVKNVQTLTSLIRFAGTRNFDNEMQLIADWGMLEPGKVFALPTLASEILHYTDFGNVQITNLEEIGGVVDAAQIGQWVAGIDPKNVPIRNRPINRFVDAINPYLLNFSALTKLNFMFFEKEHLLLVKYDNEVPIRLFNLHIHSKVHDNLFENRPHISQLFDSVNNNTSFIFDGTRKIQVINYFKFRVGNFFKDPSRLKARLSKEIKFALGRRKSSEPFISGDSFRKMTNLIWEKSSRHFDIADVKPNSLIFVESDCISDLNENILNILTHPVTLILGNSDQNHNEDYLFIRNNPNVKKVYAQNLSTRIEGFFPLPIGLENAWRSSHGDTSAFKKLRKIELKRIPRIMWTFTIGTNPEVRGMAANELINIAVADKFGFKSPKDHRLLLLSYAFIASPPGNGLDVHRTWEAMYLGCIPIVLRSYMTEFFENLGLPIWVIDSYSQLGLIDERQLAKKYQEFKPKFENKALWFEYWEKHIRS